MPVPFTIYAQPGVSEAEAERFVHDQAVAARKLSPLPLQSMTFIYDDRTELLIGATLHFEGSPVSRNGSTSAGLLEMSLDDLFPTETHPGSKQTRNKCLNRLASVKITTVGELVAHSSDWLLEEINQFGVGLLHYTESVLADHHLALADDT